MTVGGRLGLAGCPPAHAVCVLRRAAPAVSPSPGVGSAVQCSAVQCSAHTHSLTHSLTVKLRRDNVGSNPIFYVLVLIS